MRQVKLFKSVETEVTRLESEINTWIRQSGAEVVRVTGNIAPQSSSSLGDRPMTGSDLFVIVEYEAPSRTK